MNLIHGALLVVLTFMGTMTLSAQNWYQPPAAAIAIDQAITTLAAEAPTPPANSGSMTTKQNVFGEYAKVGCNNCQARAVKLQYLKMTMLKLKEGVPTGTAVEEVKAQMLGMAGNHQQLLSLINSTYLYMVDLLS